MLAVRAFEGDPWIDPLVGDSANIWNSLMVLWGEATSGSAMFMLELFISNKINTGISYHSVNKFKIIPSTLLSFLFSTPLRPLYGDYELLSFHFCG